MNAAKRANYARLRARLLEFLGSRCVICRFADVRGLQVDHIEGGGTAELRNVNRDKWYRAILRGENASPVRLLCANCNWRARMKNAPRTAPTVKHRLAAIARLGGVCVDCCERDTDVLNIDHVFSGGGVERRSMTRTQYYAQMDAASGRYQVRCVRCNWIKKSVTPEEVPHRKRQPQAA